MYYLKPKILKHLYNLHKDHQPLSYSEYYSSERYIKSNFEMFFHHNNYYFILTNVEMKIATVYEDDDNFEYIQYISRQLKQHINFLLKDSYAIRNLEFDIVNKAYSINKEYLYITVKIVNLKCGRLEY